MVEIWRDIEGYEGYFQVSNYGRVRSMDRVVYGNGSYKNGRLVKGKIMKLKNLEYTRVNLQRNNIKDTRDVHILVAKAFPDICGDWFYGCDVHHKDVNRYNNNADNLVVCTREKHWEMHHEIRRLTA